MADPIYRRRGMESQAARLDAWGRGRSENLAALGGCLISYNRLGEPWALETRRCKTDTYGRYLYRGLVRHNRKHIIGFTMLKTENSKQVRVI